MRYNLTIDTGENPEQNQTKETKVTTTRTISHMLAELKTRRDMAPAVIEAAHQLRDQGWIYEEIGQALYGTNLRSPSSQGNAFLVRHSERRPDLTITDPVKTLTVYRLLTARVHDNIMGLSEQGVAVKDIAAAAGCSDNAVWHRINGVTSPEIVRFPHLVR